MHKRRGVLQRITPQLPPLLCLLFGHPSSLSRRLSVFPRSLTSRRYFPAFSCLLRFDARALRAPAAKLQFLS